MLSVHLICVGNLKESFWRAAAAEYEKRLSRYCRLTIAEIPEIPLPASASRKEIEKALDTEGERIAAKIPPKALVCVLTPEGKSMPSEEFARIAPAAAERGGKLCFLMGGSAGLSAKIKASADLRISMSAMTFPHTLARVMLLEQLYRGFKIENGETYHK